MLVRIARHAPLRHRLRRPVQPRRHQARQRLRPTSSSRSTSVADGKELKSFEGHTHHVLAVDWKSDGKQLVTGGADNVLKVWDFETGEQVRTLQPAGKQVTAVRWVPGKPEVAGASGDKTVRFWNPDNGGIAADLQRARATMSSAWRSRRTARASPPGGPTASSSSGTARTARSSARSHRPISTDLAQASTEH